MGRVKYISKRSVNRPPRQCGASISKNKKQCQVNCKKYLLPVSFRRRLFLLEETLVSPCAKSTSCRFLGEKKAPLGRFVGAHIKQWRVEQHSSTEKYSHGANPFHQHGWGLISLIRARQVLPVFSFPYSLGIEPSNPHAC